MAAEKSVAIDLNGKHKEAVAAGFGPVVGNAVHHAINKQAEGFYPWQVNSPWIAALVFAPIFIYNRNFFGRAVRSLAVPSKTGFVSQTISKLPKQF